MSQRLLCCCDTTPPPSGPCPDACSGNPSSVTISLFGYSLSPGNCPCVSNPQETPISLSMTAWPCNRVTNGPYSVPIAREWAYRTAPTYIGNVTKSWNPFEANNCVSLSVYAMANLVQGCDANGITHWQGAISFLIQQASDGFCCGRYPCRAVPIGVGPHNICDITTIRDFFEPMVQGVDDPACVTRGPVDGFGFCAANVQNGDCSVFFVEGYHERWILEEPQDRVFNCDPRGSYLYLDCNNNILSFSVS